MQRQLDFIKAQVLGQYEVRKSAAQKDAFIKWACEYARELDVQAQVESSGKWLNTRNIIFGDLNTARILITAHYDTCARLPFGNPYTPSCWPLIALTQFVLPLALYMAACVWLGFWMGTLLSAFVLLLMLFGPANPHTANDNTSGVALVLLALYAFRDRKDVAFILFDNEEIGLLGSSAFIKAHTALARRAFLINLDCVSDGDTLLFAGGKGTLRHPIGKRIVQALEQLAPQYGKRGLVDELPRTLYPSDQLLFPRGTAFAALKGKRVLYLDRIHSARDTAFDDVNLLCLLNVLEEAITQRKGTNDP